MPRETIRQEGVDILFDRRQTSPTVNQSDRPESPHDGEAEGPSVGISEKEKDSFYLLAETIDTIEQLRRQLRREHGLSRRVASKSAVVDAAIHLVAERALDLARWLAKASD